MSGDVTGLRPRSRTPLKRPPLLLRESSQAHWPDHHLPLRLLTRLHLPLTLYLFLTVWLPLLPRRPPSSPDLLYHPQWLGLRHCSHRGAAGSKCPAPRSGTVSRPRRSRLGGIGVSREGVAGTRGEWSGGPPSFVGFSAAFARGSTCDFGFGPGRPRLKPNASTLRARFVLAIEPSCSQARLPYTWTARVSWFMVSVLGVLGFALIVDFVSPPPCRYKTRKPTLGQSCGLRCGPWSATSRVYVRFSVRTATWSTWVSRGGGGGGCSVEAPWMV